MATTARVREVSARRARKSKQGPFATVKYGSAVVPIYESSSKGRIRYCFAYYRDGKRMRQFFADPEAARKEAKFVAQRIQSGMQHVTDLKPHERDSYVKAVGLLAELDVPLVAAVEDYVQARKLADGESLTSIIEDYRKVFRPLTRRANVPEVVAELLVARTQDGASRHYLSNLRTVLNRFAAAFPGEILTITSSDIDGWLRGLGLSGWSRNSMLVCVKVLFSFARSRNYLPSDQRTAAEQVKKVKVKNDAVAVFTPDQMQALLDHNGRRWPNGRREVVYVDGSRRQVFGDEWPAFLADQERLIANRSERAKQGLPLVSAVVGLPDGTRAEQLDGSYRLTETSKSPSGSGSGHSSGTSFNASQLIWFHPPIQTGTVTRTLHFNNMQSESVTVTFSDKLTGEGTSGLAERLAAAAAKAIEDSSAKGEFIDTAGMQEKLTGIIMKIREAMPKPEDAKQAAETVAKAGAPGAQRVTGPSASLAPIVTSLGKVGGGGYSTGTLDAQRENNRLTADTNRLLQQANRHLSKLGGGRVPVAAFG